MKNALGALGFIITLMGISGTIDHLWRQPIMGWALNYLNREVFSQVDWISDYALFANLIVAACGVSTIVMAEQINE